MEEIRADKLIWCVIDVCACVCVCVHAPLCLCVCVPDLSTSMCTIHIKKCPCMLCISFIDVYDRIITRRSFLLLSCEGVDGTTAFLSCLVFSVSSCIVEEAVIRISAGYTLTCQRLTLSSDR